MCLSVCEIHLCYHKGRRTGFRAKNRRAAAVIARLERPSSGVVDNEHSVHTHEDGSQAHDSHLDAGAGVCQPYHRTRLRQEAQRMGRLAYNTKVPRCD
jgi:hypothetical protein